MIAIFTVEGDLISRCEMFDEADLDTALARFEELQPQTPRLENAAGQAYARMHACFAARDWDAMAEASADEIFHDDRRRVVGAGLRAGRDAVVAEFAALAEIGVKRITFDIIATRGSRLVLTRSRASGRDPRADAFRTDVLNIAEFDADERIVALITFDPDDFDAAIAEFDSRYLAGEAAAHGRTWSAISGGYAAINRHELPSTTPDCVNIDRRREIAMGVGDLIAHIGAGLDRDQDYKVYVEAVHRLTNPGAVVTYAAYETSQEGFDAEWRGIAVFTVERDMVSRTEVFDEADLDTALGRFDELSRPAPHLENAASLVTERFQAHFAARDWAALGEILADGFSSDDRRRVVGAGVRHGRDAQVANTQAIAELWSTNVTRSVIATRGRDLVLVRITFSSRDEGVEAFLAEVLMIVEIDADEKLASMVTFDVDDIDSAIAELDARYLAGEAAAHARTWSVIGEVYAAVNRREIPATAPDLVDIDHRSLAAIGSGDLKAYLQAAWKDSLRQGIYIETVHRLTDLGAVVTHVAKATSREGFDAEWRITSLFIVGDDLINRYEIFDEADLDAALARFEELHPQTRRLENAASRVDGRFQACFGARDWNVMAEMLSDGFSIEDRRRVVNMGNLHGRDAELGVHAYATDGNQNVESTVIATRAQRLALTHYRFSGHDQRPDAFRVEMLAVVEIDAEERMAAVVVFDADDIEGAFAELDARYIAGEAAVHTHTWSVISEAYAALNRRTLPATTPDWANVDNRHFGTIEPNALTPNIRAFWDITSEARIDIATVHRLTNLGAVVAHATHATSQEGVEIESGEIIILMVDGDRLSRCEIFNEADLDAALARFEELHPETPRLENPASRVTERFQAHFAARDWAAMGEILADGFSSDDRRRVVGAGVRDGRHAEIADMAATADLGITHVTSTVLATRGGRLTLMRGSFTNRDQGPEPFLSEALGVVEINAYERIVAFVTFDLDDVEAAFAELDARYLAGEAAAHTHTWSLITEAFAAINRHELPELTPDWVNVDHRRGAAFAAGEMTAYLHDLLDDVPDIHVYAEVVHGLGNLGAVVTQAGHGTSQEGFQAEWREIGIFMFDGDRLSRYELFDETDLDAALARFDELQPQAARLENAASQAVERFWKYSAAREWAALAETMADDVCSHDRRRVVNGGELRGRADHVTNMRAVAEVGFERFMSSVIASRGQHLVLIRIRSSVHGSEPGEVTADMLSIIEIDTEKRISGAVIFDGNDIDAAFEELDGRYLAGEAAAHAQTWTAITKVQAAYNRHEVPPTTADYVGIDHRRGRAFAPGDTIPYLRATYGVAPNVKGHLEAVHRLGSRGVVITEMVSGTSEQGFAFEWREVGLIAFKGDLVSRFEMFDEEDLDAALVRFDELNQPAS